jgi:hypothetical protein
MSVAMQHLAAAELVLPVQGLVPMVTQQAVTAELLLQVALDEGDSHTSDSL